MVLGGVLLCKVNGVYYYKRCVRCTVMNRVSENTEAVACFLHQRRDREKERKQRELERVKTKRWMGKKRKDGKKGRERRNTERKKCTSSLPHPSTPLSHTSNSDDSDSDRVVCVVSVHLTLCCVRVSSSNPVLYEVSVHLNLRCVQCQFI